ncbi:MAG: hypothetical protein IPL78_17180 [Chloroflexi bacterium]|nr:hypothetical protein [Chloroflexota bacterium]
MTTFIYTANGHNLTFFVLLPCRSIAAPAFFHLPPDCQTHEVRPSQ